MLGLSRYFEATVRAVNPARAVHGVEQLAKPLRVGFRRFDNFLGLPIGTVVAEMRWSQKIGQVFKVYSAG